MIILAINCLQPQPSFALARADGTLLQPLPTPLPDEPAQPRPNRHGQDGLLLPALQQFLAASDCAPATIRRIVTLAGPGSFTGLRLGLAVAAGLAAGWNIPALALPRFALYRAMPRLLPSLGIASQASECRWVVLQSGRHELFVSDPAGQEHLLSVAQISQAMAATDPLLTDDPILCAQLRQPCQIAGRTGPVAGPTAVATAAAVGEPTAERSFCQPSATANGHVWGHLEAAAAACFGAHADPAAYPLRPLYGRAPDISPAAADRARHYAIGQHAGDKSAASAAAG